MSVAYWDPFLYICYDAVPAKVSAITADAVSEKTRGVIFPATLAFDAHAINVAPENMITRDFTLALLVAIGCGKRGHHSGLVVC